MLFKHTIVRYSTVTFLSYVALLGGVAFCVEVLGTPQTYAYYVVLTLVYIAVYISSSRFVFEANAHKKQIRRFLILIVCSWFLSNVVYTLLVSYTTVHYLVAAFTNVLLFGAVRYELNKHWVFGKEE